MANVKITDLASGTSLVGTELFESVQSASSVKLTSDQIKTFTNKDPVLATSTSATNTPATAATLSHETSAVPTAGIGVRLDFLVAKFLSTGDFSIVGDTLTIGASRTPASAGAPGTAGEICWDSSYIYVCVATDTWKRVGLSTW